MDLVKCSDNLVFDPFPIARWIAPAREGQGGLKPGKHSLNVLVLTVYATVKDSQHTFSIVLDRKSSKKLATGETFRITNGQIAKWNGWPLLCPVPRQME